jgi:acetaldehyde dehydrogenase
MTIRVGVLGTGNIGTDICERLMVDPDFEVTVFVGRRQNSPGIERMRGRVRVLVLDAPDSVAQIWEAVDGIFDATSAQSHRFHWMEAKLNGKFVIDLTPSRIGTPIVPVLIGKVESMSMQTDYCANYSMVTCGGQSSAPLLFALARHSDGISDVEVSSSIASLSAGPATRDNLDEYIAATEDLVSSLTGISSVKSILVLNPSTPPVTMRTTVHLRANSVDLDGARNELEAISAEVRSYVPGYEVTVKPHLAKSGVVSATVSVEGAGYFLPTYSGNLDIINAAAVEVAKAHAMRFL